MIKLSIITISFNQIEFLQRCLDSVVDQLTDEIEYIVVDAGSTDGSRELISTYNDKLISVLESDDGPADGLNKGVTRCNGKYFMYINSDDYLLDNALDNILKYINYNDSINYCFSGYLVNVNEKKLRYMRSFQFTAARFFFGFTSIFQQGTVLNTLQAKECGFFNTNNRTCWDAELMVKMSLRKYQFKDVNCEVAAFRLHGESITGKAENLVENNANKRRMFGMWRNNLVLFHVSKFIKLFTSKLKYFYIDYLVKNLFLVMKRT